VDHARRAADAFPLAEPGGQPPAVLVLDEHVEQPLEDEERFLDLVRMGRVALPGLDIHDAERMRPRRDGVGIAVLARSAGTDEAVLRPLVAFYPGILERRPVGHAIAKTRDIACHDVLE
jgi:hypothetical protein